MWDNLTIDGFSFSGAKEYEEAKREYETISCICSKMDVNNPEISLKVYNKLTDRGSLHSIVGITFLKSMRDNVIRSGILTDEEMRPLNAPILTAAESMSVLGDEAALENDSLISEASKDVEENIGDNAEDNNDEAVKEQRIKSREDAETKKKAKQYKEIADYYRDKVKKLTIVIVAMMIVIIFLFVVAIKNKNLNLTTEEIAVQDKYAQWAEELDAREKALEERENALN